MRQAWFSWYEAAPPSVLAPDTEAPASGPKAHLMCSFYYCPTTGAAAGSGRWTRRGLLQSGPPMCSSAPVDQSADPVKTSIFNELSTEEIFTTIAWMVRLLPAAWAAACDCLLLPVLACASLSLGPGRRPEKAAPAPACL